MFAYFWPEGACGPNYNMPKLLTCTCLYFQALPPHPPLLSVVTNATVAKSTHQPCGEIQLPPSLSVRRIGMWRERKGLFNRRSDNIYTDTTNVLIQGWPYFTVASDTEAKWNATDLWRADLQRPLYGWLIGQFDTIFYCCFKRPLARRHTDIRLPWWLWSITSTGQFSFPKNKSLKSEKRPQAKCRHGLTILLLRLSGWCYRRGWRYCSHPHRN